MADTFHFQLFSGKYGCAVTTTGGSGDKDVLTFINYFLNELGVVTVGEVRVAPGRDLGALDPAIDEASTLETTLAESIQKKRAYPKQEKQIAERRAFFVRLINANREDWTHQYEYWIEKGWMQIRRLSRLEAVDPLM